MTDFSLSKKLFNRTFSLLERSLDVRTLNHRVLAANIANSETPDYLSREVPFQKVLERSMDSSQNIGLKRTHARHLPEDQDEDPGVEMTSEAVDIDKEMAKLAENNIKFQAAVQTLVKKFEGLKLVIIDIGR